MKERHFRFKQFALQHKYAAQKVSTDSILLGSWAEPPKAVGTAIDIGAGIGILGLLLLQRFPHLEVSFVEKNEEAFRDLLINCIAHPQADNTEAHLIDIAAYIPERLYDFAICNPPYFNQALLSSNKLKNTARHNGHDFLECSLTWAKKNMHKKAQMAWVFPYAEHEKFEQLLNDHDWFAKRKCIVRHTETSQPSLVLLNCSRGVVPAQIEELVLYQTKSLRKTEAFHLLTQDFYLKR